MKQYLHIAPLILLIDWCLTPTLTVFQLYRGVNKVYK